MSDVSFWAMARLQSKENGRTKAKTILAFMVQTPFE
jgi:hypothetical protein